MANDMIERVYEAILDAANAASDTWNDNCTTTMARAAARAAIQAMREPTDEMEIIGGATEAAEGLSNGDCREIWQAMIDAALGTRLSHMQTDPPEK